MRIGFSLPSSTRFHGVLGDVVAYERAGLDVVWVGESYGFDAVSAMGALAVLTSRVSIGSSVLGLYARTPAMTAMSAAGVDALSGGRVLLGLGSSGPQVVEGWHGVPFDAPVGRTREVVDICRAVWRRERLQHRGRRYRIPTDQGTGLSKPLKLINPPVRDRIPIYLAALGERNVALTAEIADGWLPAFLWPEKIGEIWGGPLAEGAAKRPSELGALEIVASAQLCIGDGSVIDRQRPHVAHYIGGMGARGRNFYHELACRYGFEREAATIQDHYLAGDRDRAAAEVPAELLAHISLTGSPEQVATRLRAYRDAGVGIINVNPVGDTVEQRADQIRALRRMISAT